MDQQGTLTIIKGEILKEKMKWDEIEVNNLKIDKSGRLIKYNYTPQMFICLSKNEDEHGKIKSYTVLRQGNIEVYSPEVIKGNLLINDIYFTNLYLSKSGRLLDKKHKLLPVEHQVMAFIELLKRQLYKGTTIVAINYYYQAECIDTDELPKILPEFMIQPVLDILGFDQSMRSVEIILQSLVFQAIKELSNRGFSIEKKLTYYKCLEIENYSAYYNSAE